MENSQKPQEHATKSPKNAAQSVTIEGGNKNAHEGAGNTIHGLTRSNEQTKGGASNMLPENGWYLEDRDLAVHFLENAQRDYNHAQHMRLYYAKNARKHGLTNQAIANIYGVTEGAIRAMLKKAGE